VRASVTLGNDDITEVIGPNRFGFSIPDQATIDGIEVSIERRGVAVSGTPETRLILRKNDNSSVSKIDTSSWPLSDSVLTLGGPSDLWGTTWTAADINGSSFGFRPQIQVRTRASDSGTFELDHVTVTVYFTHPVPLNSQGPLGGASASQGTGAGPDWVPVGAILASDDVRASVTLGNDDITERIDPFNFGFSIPDQATIDGIEVSIERRGVAVSGTPETRVFLRKSDNSSVSNKLDTSSWPLSDSVLTLGGPSDLWGTTWTAADINGSGFGFRPSIQVRTRASDSGTFELDYVTVTVYFTHPVPLLQPWALCLLALALMVGGGLLLSKKSGPHAA